MTTMATEARSRVARRFDESIAATERFFEAEAGRVANACHAVARRFERGGRLLVFGSGAEATDAQHVAVEFVHPVLVGKRALPALALPADGAALSGIARAGAGARSFARLLGVLGTEADIALAIARAAPDPLCLEALHQARAMGMLTLALTGTSDAPADFVFAVPSQDPFVVQEVQETLYHVIWELVHVCLVGGVAP